MGFQLEAVVGKFGKDRGITSCYLPGLPGSLLVEGRFVEVPAAVLAEELKGLIGRRWGTLQGLQR